LSGQNKKKRSASSESCCVTWCFHLTDDFLEPVSGALFRLQDECGRTLACDSSDENGAVCLKASLRASSAYTLCETTVPIGYGGEKPRRVKVDCDCNVFIDGKPIDTYEPVNPKLIASYEIYGELVVAKAGVGITGSAGTAEPDAIIHVLISNGWVTYYSCTKAASDGSFSISNTGISSTDIITLTQQAPGLGPSPGVRIPVSA